MKFDVSIGDQKDSKNYEIEFFVKATQEASDKDREKIYKIIRIIDSLGDDTVDETSDKDYRFQTDQDEGIDLLNGVLEENLSQ